MSKFNKFKRSAERFLRQVFHKPKAKISRGSVLIIVAMTLIFFAALLLRLEPLFNAQPIVRAFDPWFQLKVTEYVAENGYMSFFSWYDYSTWVPFGRDMTSTSYIGVPFTSTFFYWVANSVGIEVSVLTVSLVLPAIMGALTTIVAFFFGREVSNNTVGLLNALFLAFMPAFLQRTIAGFYDNEAVGVFAIVLILFFFTHSLKRGSPYSGVAAGLSLGYLLASWGAGDFILGLLALYGFLMFIGGRYSQRLLTSYVLTITFGVFLGVLVPRNGFGSLTSMTYLAAIGIGGLLAFYEIWQRIGHYRTTTASILAPHMKSIVLGLLAPLIGITGYYAYISSTDLSIVTTTSNPITFIGAKFLSVINPFFRLDQRIFASVAEHLPSPWGSFYQTLLVLIIFFPLGMYFAYRRGKDEDWLVLLFGLTAVYFTGSMIRLALILAPAAAVLAAISVNGIIMPFAKIVKQQSVFERRRFKMSSSLTSEHAIAAFAFVGLLLSVNIVLGTMYVTQVSPPEFAPAQISASSQVTDWQSTMTYIRNVIPGATIASWWDYGYWINSASGAKTIVDNATFNSTQIALMGYALMSLNLTESLRTFSQWNASHVLVYWGHRTGYFGGDDGKWPWMVRIAEDNLGSSMIDDATYLGDNPTTPDTEEEEYTLNPFFQSTLYKLMLFGEPADETEGNAMGLSSNRLYWDKFYYSSQYNSDTRWVSNIPDSLYGAFTLEFTSYSFGTVKVYSIDYTMLEQYYNRTAADWVPDLDSLGSMELDGEISSFESDYSSYDIVFGGGYDATVYTRSNSTHMYYGIQMDNYTLGEDAFGLQLSPIDSTDTGDLRLVNYAGNDYYDGHIDYYGEWAEDSSGSDESEYATGEHVIEFLIPLSSADSQDLNMIGGMNYQIQFLFWNNANTGNPTLDSDWAILWAPVELH